jgi:hypothetical protein
MPLPSARLGDQAEVLAAVGYSPVEVEELRAAGAFGPNVPVAIPEDGGA